MAAGDVIDSQTAQAIENAGIVTVDVIKKDEYTDEDKVLRVVGNNFVDINSFEELKDIDINIDEFSEKVYFPVMREIIDEAQNPEEIKTLMERRKKSYVQNTLPSPISLQL